MSNRGVEPKSSPHRVLALLFAPRTLLLDQPLKPAELGLSNKRFRCLFSIILLTELRSVHPCSWHLSPHQILRLAPCPETQPSLAEGNRIRRRPIKERIAFALVRQVCCRFLTLPYATQRALLKEETRQVQAWQRFVSSIEPGRIESSPGGEEIQG